MSKPRTKRAAPLTETQVIRALEKLAAGWPKDLWLFSASSTLHLMRNVDGQRVFDRHGGVEQTLSVWSTRDIDNDGGDW